jgi:hypothetical protein
LVAFSEPPSDSTWLENAPGYFAFGDYGRGQAALPDKGRAPCFDHHAKARRITGKDDIAGPRIGGRDTWKASAIG